MITPAIEAAVPQFLAYFLQPLRLASGGGPLSSEELARYVVDLGPELEVTVGEYGPYLGAVAECAGITFPVERALSVSRTPVIVEPGGPAGVTVSHDESPHAPVPRKYVLRWLVERADLRLDGAETMRRALADLRPPATWDASGEIGEEERPPVPGAEEGEGGEGTAGEDPTYGQRVADAIAATGGEREHPANLEEVTAVPAGLDLAVEEYHRILARFFTFDDDGHYYAKWWSANEGDFPLETTERYRRLNVATPELAGDNVFVLGNVPADFGLPGHERRRAGEFREFIARIDASAGDASALEFDVVSSAAKSIEIAGAPARDLFDFCFFTVRG